MKSYSFAKAADMLSRALAMSFREVPRFIRIWAAPPVPYDDPGFKCTFAFSTNQRSRIISGVTAGFEASCSFVSLAACSPAPTFSMTPLTSSHAR